MAKPKRYLAFAGENYYPCGGWSDLQGSYDTIDQAIHEAQLYQPKDGWYCVVDLETGEVIFQTV